MILTPELQNAFEETHYIVHHQPPFTLRVGKACPALDELLQARGQQGAAFITACNPNSQSMSSEGNASRQEELLADIRALSLISLPGIGRHRDNCWPDSESILILGINLDAAKALASKHGQWAFVWAPASGVPELVVLPQRPRPPISPAEREAGLRRMQEFSDGIRKALASGSLAGRDTP